MDPLTTEDSYADRRQLFKSIWETVEPKDDIMNKPKVIKTLRIEEDYLDDSKKRQSKILQAMCNKILDHHCRPDTDNSISKQVNEKKNGTAKRNTKETRIQSQSRSPAGRAPKRDDFSVDITHQALRNTSPVKTRIGHGKSIRNTPKNGISSGKQNMQNK